MVDMDDLRRSVERKKKRKKVAELKKQLWNTGKPIDYDAIYYTAEQLSKITGVPKPTIHFDIRNGNLEARFDVHNGRRKWLIHPDDAKQYKKEKNWPKVR